MGIHKGADIKNWNVGTFIKDPIIKFYEENKINKEDIINKVVKDKESIIKFNEEINNKKENVEVNEKGKIKKDDVNKKEEIEEIEYRIELLPEDYYQYDLSFKTILLGDSSKFYLFYKYINLKILEKMI